MKKGTKIIFRTFCIFLAAAAVSYVIGWWSSIGKPADLPALTAVLNPADGITPGSKITAQVELQLPLASYIANIHSELPAGAIQVGSPSVSGGFPRLTRRAWKITVDMRAFRTGKSGTGKIVFDIFNRRNAPESVSAAIPEFEISPAKTEGKLQLASQVDIPGRSYLSLIISAVILLAAGIAAALYLRRPKKPKELTEWEKSVGELTELRQKIDSGKLAPEEAFILLVELMRRYLERRFDLPVTRRTAQEFITILEQYGDRFPAESRPFLRNFLAEADLVKFARMIPDNTLVGRSAGSAGEFINRTRPESEVKNV